MRSSKAATHGVEPVLQELRCACIQIGAMLWCNVVQLVCRVLTSSNKGSADGANSGVPCCVGWSDAHNALNSLGLQTRSATTMIEFVSQTSVEQAAHCELSSACLPDCV